MAKARSRAARVRSEVVELFWVGSMNSWSSFLFPATFRFLDCGSGRDEEPCGEKVLRLIQIRLTTPSLEKICGLGKTNRCCPRTTRIDANGSLAARLKSYGLFNAVCPT